MQNGDPRDGFFYPTLTLMIDSYTILLNGFISTPLTVSILVTPSDCTFANSEDQMKCSIMWHFIRINTDWSDRNDLQKRNTILFGIITCYNSK